MATLVVTDLDGTLWGASEQCHPRTLQALEKLGGSDVSVLAATGRRQWGAHVGFDRNGLALPALVVNGASGHDFTIHKNLYSTGFATEDAVRIVEALHSVGLSPVTLTFPDSVLVGPTPAADPRYLEVVAEQLVRCADLAERIQTSDVSVLGFSLFAMSESDLELALGVLRQLGHDAYHFHLDRFYPGWMLMVQPTGVNKWSGVQRYIKEQNLDIDRVVALGDGTNDLPMLAGADLAIGIKRGSAEALELADVVIDHPDDGGWGDVLGMVL